MRGQVVGIPTAVISQGEGIGLAISIDSAEPVVQELIDSGSVDRGFLGVSIVEITPALAESFGLAVDHGIGLRGAGTGGPPRGGGPRPGGGVAKKAGVGGTKTLDVSRVVALKPDLVVASAEENRREDIEALVREGLRVYVTLPTTVAGASDLLAEAGPRP